MPWSRASELDRAVACPASTHLPRLGEKSQRAKDAAEWGTALHAWKETGAWPLALSGRWAGKVPLVYQRRQANLTAAGMSREDLWPSEGRHEVSYALNTQSRMVAQFEGATTEERNAWKASFDDRWVTGTADYVGDIFGVPWVDDLKTGNPEYLPSDPWELWQLRMYAICVALFSLCKEVWVSITSWPQFPASGVPARFFKKVHRDELVGTTLPLLEYARQAAVASRTECDARPGDQCGKWTDREGQLHYLCASAPSCPMVLPGMTFN